MKILLTHRYCLIGGLESWMLALQRAYTAAGHTCELFFFTDGPLRALLPPEVPAHFGGLAACVRLVRTAGFEIVHAPTMDWQVGISAVRRAGAKLIVTAHNQLEHGFTAAACDALSAVSTWLAAATQAQTDLPVQVIYNGVDLARFSPAPPSEASPGAPFGSAGARGPIVAWAGRGLEWQHKQLDRFAALAPALRQAGCRLWLAEPYGPAALADARPEVVAQLEPHVEFWGAVPAARMPDFYRQVAASGGVFVSTSAYEGFGLVQAEAQACGCLVIAPDVCGINEVVQPTAGGVLYAPDLAPAQLAQLILTVLHDVVARPARRAAARARVQTLFGLERMAADYLALYQTAPAAPLATAQAARRRLAPWRAWPAYLAHRWSPGREQYEASCRLAAQHEWQLAAALARTAWATCPTLFARPQRLAHLLKTQVYARAS